MFEIMTTFMTTAIVFIVIVSALIFVNAQQLEKRIPAQRAELIEQAKMSENFLRDEELLSDILEYNKTLRTLIGQHRNPWTNFMAPIDLSGNKAIDLYDILQEIEQPALD